jgi:ABC-type transport system involved in resistance to organic solvents, periplasmic component
MKRDNINYLAVGVFVLSILAVFFYVMYKITGKAGPTDEYFVVYKNITGIKDGTPVLYEGYQIGQVEKIEPILAEGTTRYRLGLSVVRNWRIPSDSVASLIASGLLSAITIDIREGSSSTMLQPGGTLTGREAANFFTAVNEVADELQDLSRNSLKPLIDNLNNEIETLAAELHNLTTKSIQPLIENINQKLDKQVFTDLADLLGKLNDGADRMLVLLDDENQENLQMFLANMESSSRTLNDLLTRIEETRSAMDQLVQNIDGMVVENDDNIRNSVKDLHRTLDVISQNINAITYHLEGSSRNIHELSRAVRENPGLLLRSSPQPDEEIRK